MYLYTHSTLYLYVKYTLGLKKIDTDVAHYNFNAHQQILVIFSRDVAERVILANGDLLFHLS